MIGHYFKQYGLFYLLYVLMTAVFLLTFWLYRLPMSYLGMATLFNLLLMIPLATWHFFGFQGQMRLLDDFKDLEEIAELSSPLDEAYQKALSARDELAAQAIFQAQNQAIRQQDLIKMWAHQMKVPLSAISLMAQTKQLNPDEVNQQVLRLERYLETLLTYLKFGDKRDDFRFEEVSVSQVMKDLIKKYRILFFQKRLSVDLTGDWTLKTDKKWLTFALSQILDNAIKYSHDGGKITVTLTEKSVTIADQGMGILAEDLPRLFEEGFTGYNGHEHQKASGFGLYMTKQVLDQLGLTISVTSQVDVGTQVHISKM